jgi:hypothetical protein
MKDPTFPPQCTTHLAQLNAARHPQHSQHSRGQVLPHLPRTKNVEMVSIMDFQCDSYDSCDLHNNGSWIFMVSIMDFQCDLGKLAYFTSLN